VAAGDEADWIFWPPPEVAATQLSPAELGRGPGGAPVRDTAVILTPRLAVAFVMGWDVAHGRPNSFPRRESPTSPLLMAGERFSIPSDSDVWTELGQLGAPPPWFQEGLDVATPCLLLEMRTWADVIVHIRTAVLRTAAAPALATPDRQAALGPLARLGAQLRSYLIEAATRSLMAHRPGRERMRTLAPRAVQLMATTMHNVANSTAPPGSYRLGHFFQYKGTTPSGALASVVGADARLAGRFQLQPPPAAPTLEEVPGPLGSDDDDDEDDRSLVEQFVDLTADVAALRDLVTRLVEVGGMAREDTAQLRTDFLERIRRLETRVAGAGPIATTEHLEDVRMSSAGLVDRLRARVESLEGRLAPAAGLLPAQAPEEGHVLAPAADSE
jgi:polyhydroxyalkanoate synthesis regulator phasin